MSHSKERSEKICLNCNAALSGRYCHVCGQENTEPKETVWGLVTHFFNDITHFDGKFFSTLKYLVFRPGFLSAEYIKGRRASYLNPIRMYVFTSALFFIIFFSVYNPDDMVKTTTTSDSTSTSSVLRNLADSARKAANTNPGIAAALELAHSREDSVDILSGLAQFVDTIPVDPKDTARKNYRGVQWKIGDDTTTVEEYDSIQAALPAKNRDGWFKRVVKRRSLALQAKYGDDGTALLKAWTSNFVHQFPKLLFVSLPIFALILRLLYIRRRKQFFYVDHGIFSIHLYIFSFILLLTVMGISGLTNWTGWGWLQWLQLPIWLYSLYYIYKAMRVFYRQGRGKTIVKFLLLNFLAMITIIILFVIFFAFAAFQI